jgi:hypothetical protein
MGIRGYSNEFHKLFIPHLDLPGQLLKNTILGRSSNRCRLFEVNFNSQR